MKKIVNYVKRFILEKRIERCEWKMIKLQNELEDYHKEILSMIHTRKNKINIDKLRFKRDKAYEVKYNLICKKYDLKRRLIEV